MAEQKEPDVWGVLVGGLVMLGISAGLGALALFDDEPLGAGATFVAFVVGGLGAIVTLIGATAIGVSLGLRHSKFH